MSLKKQSVKVAKCHVIKHFFLLKTGAQQNQAKMAVPGKPFQPCIIFTSEAVHILAFHHQGGWMVPQILSLLLAFLQVKTPV